MEDKEKLINNICKKIDGKFDRSIVSDAVEKFPMVVNYYGTRATLFGISQSKYDIYYVGVDNNKGIISYSCCLKFDEIPDQEVVVDKENIERLKAIVELDNKEELIWLAV